MLQTADVISELKKLIIKSEKPYDLDAVDRAITAACKAHEGQRRSSGEAYVCHPLKVAKGRTLMPPSVTALSPVPMVTELIDELNACVLGASVGAFPEP